MDPRWEKLRSLAGQSAVLTDTAYLAREKADSDAVQGDLQNLKDQCQEMIDLIRQMYPQIK